jgi:hypothetical protein
MPELSLDSPDVRTALDKIEAAGCLPKLVHAPKAKLMMGEINKTDKLDVRGLNQLQRTG